MTSSVRRNPRRPPSAADPAPALPPLDPVAAARFAGLRWVTDLRPGIRRVRHGRGFAYRSPTGEPITDPTRLAWIRAIVIPPAWTDVWISPFMNGHIQATGRDARGRKQYRYAPPWREVRDATKYTRLIEFGEGLPRIRAAVERDLGRSGLPRERVLAAIVWLLDRTFIRVGNEEYARLNRSFGLTTLRSRHVTVTGTALRFRFRGKSGKVHDIGLRNRRVAGLIRRIQELPGQELFSYPDDSGGVQTVGSDDVNAYLREIAHDDVTAKEFRTWAGTVLAYRALCGLDRATSDAECRRQIAAAIRDVARQLGNTPAVCRKSYVHPAILDAHIAGELARSSDLPPAEAAAAASAGAAHVTGAANVADQAHTADRPPSDTPEDEAAVLALLRRRAAEAAEQARQPSASSAA